MANDAVRFTMDEQRPRFERMAGRHENGTAPRAVSAYQLFQTPPDLAAQLVASLNLQPGARILEPSAGLGRLLDALASSPSPQVPSSPSPPLAVTAIEIAPNLCAELFRQHRPGVKLMQRDFLTVFPEETGHFDAIVMNPPFHLRSDIRHIEHALAFLRKGGTLAALCMDTQHRHLTLRHQSATWHEVPAGTFRAEGTQVPCIHLTITA